MALKFGAVDVDALYVGADQVSAAYLGADVVWEGAGGLPEAPEGFAYLINADGAYIVNADSAYILAKV